MNEPGALAWANVAGFAFPLGAMVAVDLTQYPTNFSQPLMVDLKAKTIMPNNANRRIVLHLLHSVSYTFKGDVADEFFKWWTELSTPKHVQGVQGVIRPA